MLHKSRGLFLPVCVREYVTAAAGTVKELTAFLLFHLENKKKTISQYCESRLKFINKEQMVIYCSAYNGQLFN